MKIFNEEITWLGVVGLVFTTFFVLLTCWLIVSILFIL